MQICGKAKCVGSNSPWHPFLLLLLSFWWMRCWCLSLSLFLPPPLDFWKFFRSSSSSKAFAYGDENLLFLSHPPPLTSHKPPFSSSVIKKIDIEEKTGKPGRGSRDGLRQKSSFFGWPRCQKGGKACVRSRHSAKVKNKIYLYSHHKVPFGVQVSRFAKRLGTGK